MDNGERDPGCCDQPLLQRLATQVGTVFQPTRSHHRQRHVVLDAGMLLDSEQIEGGRLEKIKGLDTLKRGRVAGIHDDVGTGDGLSHSRSADQVDPR